MKIKKGDKVIVVAGKEKGKTGKVVRSLPKLEKIIIEGMNMYKKHQKAKSSTQKGGIIEKAMPMHVSNVMLIDSKTGKRTRAIKEETKKVKTSKNK